MRKWWVAALGAVACRGEPVGERPPLRHSVYVWQRVWTDAVDDAVERASVDFGERVILAVETDGRGPVWSGVWSADGLPRRVLPEPVSSDAVRLQGPVSLAVRWSDADDVVSVDGVIALVQAVLDRARGLGWTVRGLHLDADVPTGRLAAWAAVVAEVQDAVDVEVSVLALVDHVDKAGWRALTEAADTVVVQVHSVPVAGADRPVLFRPDLATSAIERAGETAHGSLAVALPTHTLTDARTGGAVRAEPQEVAAWLAEVSARPPARLRGVAWFRLPVRDDSGTWTAETLDDVRGGRSPQSTVEAHLGAPPAAWAAGEAARALTVTARGRDHAWLPGLEVCVPEGRLAVAPMDPRYVDRPPDGSCVTLVPRADQLLPPGPGAPVALVLADAVPVVSVRVHGDGGPRGRVGLPHSTRGGL